MRNMGLLEVLEELRVVDKLGYQPRREIIRAMGQELVKVYGKLILLSEETASLREQLARSEDAEP